MLLPISDLYTVSILHCFRDIATFTVYVTAFDLQKSFSFDKTVKINNNNVRFPLTT